MQNKSINIFLAVTIGLLIGFQANSQNTTESVLAQGSIFQVAIPQTGIYQITYDQLLNETNIDVNNINPKNIHIYGNQGGLLPISNSSLRADDLVENNIFISGEADNSFDSGDFILFYAEGGDRLRTNVEDNRLEFEQNIYDNNNYYYIKVENTPGQRIQATPFVSSPNYQEFSEVIIRHEEERENLLGQFISTQGSGQKWFGETFTNERSQDFSETFNIPNLVQSDDAEVTMAFAGRSETTAEVMLNVNGQTFRQNISTVDLGELESIYAKEVTLSQNVEIRASQSVSVDYSPTSAESQAWLDYIEMRTNIWNRLGSSPIHLYNTQNNTQFIDGFSIETNANQLVIWDISAHGNVAQMGFEAIGGGARFGYDTEGQIKRFMAFDMNGQFMTPEFRGEIANQNLHGITSTDMVILYFDESQQAAEELAQHRQSQDGLNISTIHINQVYNEFAGGKQDPIAIRDLMRLLKDRDDNFRYLLLLGDATYDYRGVYSNLPQQNFIPTYQTAESLHPIDAFPTDDFFGLLSDNEGNTGLSGTLDIAIGRIPAKTAEEAMAVVNKIIHYDTNPNRFGDWRSTIGFGADDVDAPWDTVHLRDSDQIARNTQDEHPCFNQNKIYWDSFVQEATPGGARYPDANRRLTETLDKGNLVFTYLGHGGPRGLSQERVLQIADVSNWTNLDNLPLFITATCSFTGFDEPELVSAGEHLILNPAGGAVAIFTTVRAVFASQNRRLTESVFETLFERTQGLPSRLGDIMTNGKNELTENTSGNVDNTRKFLLIGDPSMTLALPSHNVTVEQFNNEELRTSVDSSGFVTPQLDTIGALGRASFQGQITRFHDDTPVTDFNGKIFMTVFDKPSTLNTLVNDGLGNPLSFDVVQNVLYKGSASVTNGEFDISFILPLDIDFEFGPGTVQFYATDDTSVDAHGCYDGLVIGGTSDNNISDNLGPEIDIFFDDRSFTAGGETGPDPLLLVDLADENGINLSTTSIGHDITATLEDPNGDRIVLNEFYEPSLDRIGEGTVTYQMEELEEGPHRIYIKAWDILNNSNEEAMDFVVVRNQEGMLSNIFNYPNPFSTSTRFLFDHDLRGGTLDIVINIFTLSGKLIKTIEESRSGSGRRVDDVLWDARDDFGNRLANGVYLYKINASSPELGESRESDFMKMVIIN